MKKYSHVPDSIIDKVTYIRSREEKRIETALRKLENKIAFHIVRHPEAEAMAIPRMETWHECEALDMLRLLGMRIDDIRETTDNYTTVIGHRIILK